MRTPSFSIGLLIAGFALAACDDDSIDRVPVDDSVAAGEAAGEAHATAAQTEIMGDEMITIGKSLNITMTIDMGEIQHAQIALQNADDDQVREYAQMMIDDHTPHLQLTQQMLDENARAPIDSQIAADLRAQAAAGVRELQASEDVDYDYMRLQAMMHSQSYILVGALVELMPDEPTRAFLAETQMIIGLHRDHAIEIANDL